MTGLIEGNHCQRPVRREFRPWLIARNLWRLTGIAKRGGGVILGNLQHTKGVAILLEVVQESFSNPRSSPLGTTSIGSHPDGRS